MANEITITAQITVDNGNFQVPRTGVSSLKLDQNAAGGNVPGQVSATTSGDDVDLSALGTEGWVYLRNLDATNFVQWGPYDSAFYPIGRLKPGEAALFRMDPGKTLHLKADTATCKVQVLAMED